MHLSGLLGHQLISPTDEGVGKVDDIIVRLRGDDYPVVTGVVAKIGGRRVFVPIERVAELSEQRVALRSRQGRPRRIRTTAMERCCSVRTSSDIA